MPVRNFLVYIISLLSIVFHCMFRFLRNKNPKDKIKEIIFSLAELILKDIMEYFLCVCFDSLDFNKIIISRFENL